jgi:ribosomal protein L15
MAGMSAGLPKYVTVNLDDLSEHFEAGQEVSLEALKAKGLLNTSGREDKLPLKVRYSEWTASLGGGLAANQLQHNN